MIIDSTRASEVFIDIQTQASQNHTKVDTIWSKRVLNIKVQKTNKKRQCSVPIIKPEQSPLSTKIFTWRAKENRCRSRKFERRWRGGNVGVCVSIINTPQLPTAHPPTMPCPPPLGPKPSPHRSLPPHFHHFHHSRSRRNSPHSPQSPHSPHSPPSQSPHPSDSAPQPTNSPPAQPSYTKSSPPQPAPHSPARSRPPGKAPRCPSAARGWRP
ncbi:hypothetical protein DFH27DRAFT_385823 [Peziza echinospora]|nr:hypothetical protein DFH27DRAFT_385823 [Peziza echinospora]